MIRFHIDDLSFEVYQDLRQAGRLAWDIETSGLDWSSELIGICQVYAIGGDVHIVRIGSQPPQLLKSLLEDRFVTKIFHHGVFDLRFMVHAWSANPRSILDTKIAAKILHPHRDDNGLKSLLNRYLNVDIDKSLRASDWLSDPLSIEQEDYAANDVLYLHQLILILIEELEKKELLDVAEACFEYLPTRVHLDVRGNKDVFLY